MCIVREKSLSTEDLAFLTGSNVMACEPDEDAIQRSVAIHERAGAMEFGPVPLSQIVRPFRRSSIHCP
jgi:hypothetical protein